MANSLFDVFMDEVDKNSPEYFKLLKGYENTWANLQGNTKGFKLHLRKTVRQMKPQLPPEFDVEKFIYFQMLAYLLETLQGTPLMLPGQEGGRDFFLGAFIDWMQEVRDDVLPGLLKIMGEEH